MGSVPSISTAPICGGRVTNVELQQDAAVCVLGDQARLLLSRFLGSHVAMGDEIAFAIPTEGKGGTEVLITKHAVSGRNHYLYQAPIGYVTQPKPDKRGEYFVSAEVQAGAFGIGTIFLPCQALREYFYAFSRSGTVLITPPRTRSCVFHLTRMLGTKPGESSCSCIEQ
jgi:hypothetical protein